MFECTKNCLLCSKKMNGFEYINMLSVRSKGEDKDGNIKDYIEDNIFWNFHFPKHNKKI